MKLDLENFSEKFSLTLVVSVAVRVSTGLQTFSLSPAHLGSAEQM